METDDVVKELNKLIHLDIDAIRAYEQALDAIEDPHFFKRLSDFRDDHKIHVEELCREVRRLGAMPPENKPDLKGYFIEGFTAIRSMMGIEGALKAMVGNEKLTTKTYHDVLQLDFSPAIKKLLEKNYADEQRHLAFIKNAVEQKSWEKSHVANE